jgi:hypothetical protein
LETVNYFVISKEDHDKILLFIKQAQGVIGNIIADRKRIMLIYPNLNPEKDTRITVFRALQHLLDSVTLALGFMYHELGNKSWWNKVDKKQIPDSDIRIYFSEFGAFAKVGFVQCLVSCIETAFRAFLRSIDPASCNHGLAEFGSIYECLLKSKLSKCPPDGISLLDLLRLVRNTVHNNGVYLHKSGKNATVKWRGNYYKFIQGTEIDFVTWDFIIDISDNIRQLLCFVVEDSNLKAITSEIIS